MPGGLRRTPRASVACAQLAPWIGVLLTSLSLHAAPNLVVEQPAGTSLAAGGVVAFGHVFSDYFDPDSKVQALDGTFTVTFKNIPTGVYISYQLQRSASDQGPWSGLFAPGLAPDSAGTLVFHDPIPQLNAFYRLLVTADTQRIFTLRNTGSSDLIGLGVSVDGAEAANFDLDQSALQTTLAPGDSTTFGVTYLAGDITARMVTLTISGNIPMPFSATLIGGDMPQAVHLALIRLGDTTLRLSWTGPATGVLETSTDLAPDSWSPAGSPTQQPDGSWRLDVSPSDPARFYRFKSP